MRRRRHGHRPRASLAATLLVVVAGAVAAGDAAVAQDAERDRSDERDAAAAQDDAGAQPASGDDSAAADAAAAEARAAEAGDGVPVAAPASERVTIGNVRIRGVRAALPTTCVRGCRWCRIRPSR